jgi:outer membrane protein OmpA-like peptidoglycan-associated protein
MRVIAFRLFVIVAFLSLNLLIGCAGREFAPKKGIWYYHKELPEAERAVEDAQKAGKDKECPEEFNAVKNMKDTAYEIYWSCRTKEGIDLAKDAIKNAKALCPSGHKPSAAKEQPAGKVIDRMTLTVNFDFDKSVIRTGDKAKLRKAIEFIKKYPGKKIKIEGHTDNIGTEKYNQALSERRAGAVKEYLIEKGGIDGTKITTVGYGELKPAASNKTWAGRAKNRRVEILILAD